MLPAGVLGHIELHCGKRVECTISIEVRMPLLAPLHVPRSLEGNPAHMDLSPAILLRSIPGSQSLMSQDVVLLTDCFRYLLHKAGILMFNRTCRKSC